MTPAAEAFCPSNEPRLSFMNLDDPAATAAFDHRTHIDRFGDRIHFWLAILFCVSVGGPVSVMESTGGALVICFLIRAWFIRRAVKLLIVQVPLLLTLAFCFWQSTTALWSADKHEAILQAGGMRFALMLFALFPLIRYRGWFALAIAAGFLLGNASQLAESVGLLPRAIDRSNAGASQGRIGGWWPEVIGGEVLLAALGLNLGAMYQGVRLAPANGKYRIWRIALISGLLACATLAGIVATGTRAAWIVAAVLIGLAAVCIIARIPSRKARVLIAVAAIGSTTALGLVAYAAAGEGVNRRVIDARNEISRMVDRGEYQTNTGLRIKMAQWAWQAFTEHPVRGIGVGGYRAYVLAKKPAAAGNELAAIELFEREGHGHCHNALLQAMATTGAPGMLLLAGAIVTALYAGFRRGSAGVKGGPLVLAYAAAAPWALLAMCLLWPFDVVYISAQTSAALFTAMALCPGWAPDHAR